MPTIDLSPVSWRRSSYSNSDGGQCVEVSDDFGAVIPVRDSKVPDGSVLVFPAVGWGSFISAIRSKHLGE
ncbi:DUF397 domain-containing protein [Streptomyces sp. TR02-1]|uniref:DUF397 domain-containing protein n=1 Tax=Streptomyces sp. TR02-1 TaxID=3385977 RepID=UPI0039A381CC